MDAELQKKINIQTAPAWEPASGQTIDGTVAHLGQRESQYGPYLVVTLEVPSEEDPEAVSYVAVRAFHGTLKSALYELKPSVGDRLTITYGGRKASKNRKDSAGEPVKYHVYTVIDPNAAPAEEFTWSDDPEF